MRWLAVVAVAALVFNASASAQPADFAPGQEWSVKDSTMKVIIGQVEPFSGKTAVSVAIVDVPVPDDFPGAKGTMAVGHMPFDKDTLAASVDQLVATGVPVPAGFEIGYKQWKDAHGGVFTISVAQAVAVMFQTISQSSH